MDAFFADNPAEILVKKFEELGYEFVMAQKAGVPDKDINMILNTVL